MGKSFWIAVEFLAAKILSQLSLVIPNIAAGIKKLYICELLMDKDSYNSHVPCSLMEDAGASWIMAEPFP